MNELKLVKGTKEERDKFIERVDVLEKVKELNLLPGLESFTTSQVADFYEVKNNVIRTIIQRNRDELESDGMKRMTQKEILDQVAQNVTVEKEMSFKILRYENEKVKVSNFGMNVFPKRAILRMGMLLRDSEVAKEVRTLLLNVYHDVEQEKDNVLENINKEYDTEIELQKELAESFVNGDMENFAMAAVKVTNLLNKRIDDLKPKAKYTEEVLKPNDLFTVTQIAKDLGMSAVGLNSLLHSLGIQYKQSGQWFLYSKYQNKGYTHSETILDRSDRVRMITKWTQKGRNFIYQVLEKHGIKIKSA